MLSGLNRSTEVQILGGNPYKGSLANSSVRILCYDSQNRVGSQNPGLGPINIGSQPDFEASPVFTVLPSASFCLRKARWGLLGSPHEVPADTVTSVPDSLFQGIGRMA